MRLVFYPREGDKIVLSYIFLKALVCLLLGAKQFSTILSHNLKNVFDFVCNLLCCGCALASMNVVL